MPTADQLIRLLEAEPDDTFLLYALAQEYAKAGRHAEAIETYDRVIGLEPSHGYAYFHKARSLEESGRAGEAPAVLEAGLRAARAAGDAQATAEIAAYLDELG
ncbi:MAG: tetratricopeptide repeat protein [Phycisphaerales bacterium JB039]